MPVVTRKSMAVKDRADLENTCSGNLKNTQLPQDYKIWNVVLPELFDKLNDYEAGKKKSYKIERVRF